MRKLFRSGERNDQPDSCIPKNPQKIQREEILTETKIVIEFSKVKQRILNLAKETHHIQGNPLKMAADFSAEIFQVRGKWDKLCKVLKKTLPTKPPEWPVGSQRQIKRFPGK